MTNKRIVRYNDYTIKYYDVNNTHEIYIITFKNGYDSKTVSNLTNDISQANIERMKKRLEKITNTKYKRIYVEPYMW